jgi:hypothetical protein
MLDAGLDLSRKRLDFHLLDGEARQSSVALLRRMLMDCSA